MVKLLGAACILGAGAWAWRRGLAERRRELDTLADLIALLDRSERDVWYGLEAAGCGFNVTPENLQNPEKRAKAAALLRQAAGFSDEICRLF